VIALTLLVQVPLLPPVVRWARLPTDRGAEKERRRAYIAATKQALEALAGLATERGIGQEVADHLRSEFDRRLRLLRTGDLGATDWEEQYADLRLAAIEHKHEIVVKMRDNGEIDDEVLLRLQDGLDAEAIHLNRNRAGRLG
jgi:CPA1 family monovalent cation:H+ antiporter